jgi:hypothetical protein
MKLAIAARRSTIPLQLHSRVVRQEVRKEKHPGRDDVFLLFLEAGQLLQVDRSVYERISPGETIEKLAWQRHLKVSSESVELHWSADVAGMVWAMPLIMFTFIVTWWWSISRVQAEPIVKSTTD